MTQNVLKEENTKSIEPRISVTKTNFNIFYKKETVIVKNEHKNKTAGSIEPLLLKDK